MVPLHTFMLTAEADRFLWGAELRSTATESWEMGGKGISDPSGGLTYQLWHGVLDTTTGTVLLDAPNTPQFVLYSEAGITQMDFSFDQNMKPCLAFTQNGRAYFWWYRVATLSYELLDLGDGALYPLALMDDKREQSAGFNDVLLVYLRNGRMYWREQRDNYAIEYDSNVSGVRQLLRVGFTQGLRVQVMVIV